MIDPVSVNWADPNAWFGWKEAVIKNAKLGDRKDK